MSQYKNLYRDDAPGTIYMIYDPGVRKYCQSNRYKKTQRCIWTSAQAAAVALSYMPEEVRERAIIEPFDIFDIEEDDTPGG